MKSFFTLTLIGLSLSCLSRETIKVVHYNIKELDSTKIQAGLRGESKQLQAAKNILKQFQPDILSINEVQYDYPNIPNSSYSSQGKNPEYLAKIFGIEYKSTAMFPANTGKNSKPKNGQYILKPTQEERVKYADLVNFGMFPGQYSMVGIFKYPVLRRKNIDSLPWIVFNSRIEPSDFSDAAGNSLPRTMPLFDKNFVDVTLDVNGEELHIILFHTVPAFGFGNPNTPNFERNKDQIKFLNWYLSASKPKWGIRPLGKGKTFIAMGDWNVDPESNNPGAEEIKKLLKKFKPFIKEKTITYRGSSFKEGGFTAQLDYMIFSRNIKIKSSSVYDPESKYQDVGCGNYTGEVPENMVLVDRSKTCKALVSKEYYELLTGSDHLPLYAEIEIR